MFNRLARNQTSEVDSFVDLGLVLAVVAFGVNFKDVDDEVLDVLDLQV